MCLALPQYQRTRLLSAPSSYQKACRIYLVVSVPLTITSTGSNYIWKSHIPNPNDPNSSLTYYLQFGRSTHSRLRVVSLLLTHMMSEPAFDILRTKEQLGYVVFCSELPLPGASRLGMRLVVQSERSPAYLEQRVEAFLDVMKSKIEDMQPTDFEQFKTGLRQQWTEVVKDLRKERSRYWVHIDSGYLDFLRRGSDRFSRVIVSG